MGRLAVVLALGATAVVVTNAIAKLRLQLVAHHNVIQSELREVRDEVESAIELGLVGEARGIVEKMNKEEVLGG